MPIVNFILWFWIIVGTIGLALVEGPGIFVIIGAILVVGNMPRLIDAHARRKAAKK